MEMEKMFERLLAKMEANQEKAEADRKKLRPTEKPPMKISWPNWRPTRKK
jgi:hypothetical protein